MDRIVPEDGEVEVVPCRPGLPVAGKVDPHPPEAAEVVEREIRVELAKQGLKVGLKKGGRKNLQSWELHTFWCPNT